LSNNIFGRSSFVVPKGCLRSGMPNGLTALRMMDWKSKFRASNKMTNSHSCESRNPVKDMDSVSSTE